MLVKSLYWIVTDLIGKTFLIIVAVTGVVGFFLYMSPGRIDTTLPVRKQETVAVDTVQDSDSFFVFYARWAGRVIKGELGRTQFGNVSEKLRRKIKVTGILCIGGTLLSVTISFAFGFLLVSRPNHLFTRFSLGSIYLVTALPTFFLAYMSLSILPHRFEGFLSYISPIVILAVGDGLISEFSRIVAGGVKDELKRPYIETAIVKGLRKNAFLPWPGTTLYHASRQAITHIIPHMGLRIPQIAGLSMIVEKIFAMDGLGDMLLDSLGTKDVNCALIVVLCLTLLVRSMTILNDALLYVLNPRLRLKT